MCLDLAFIGVLGPSGAQAPVSMLSGIDRDVSRQHATLSAWCLQEIPCGRLGAGPH